MNSVFVVVFGFIVVVSFLLMLGFMGYMLYVVWRDEFHG